MSKFLGMWVFTMLLTYPSIVVWIYVSAMLLSKVARRPYAGPELGAYRWTILLACALHALTTAPIAGLLMSMTGHR
jgi:hypothetical protein